MNSENDLPGQQNTGQQQSILKKSSPIWIVYIITLFVLNSILTALLILAIFSLLGLIIPGYFGLFLVWAIINYMIISFVSKKQTNSIAKVICKISLIFPIFYSFLSFIGFILFILIKLSQWWPPK